MIMADPKYYPDTIKQIAEYVGQIRKLQPDSMAGFQQLAKAATSPGALDTKTKELIAMAIGIALRCDGCIGFHAKALVEAGATREELADVVAMCVYMGGGPSLMYAADALRAYDQFVDIAAKPKTA